MKLKKLILAVFAQNKSSVLLAKKSRCNKKIDNMSNGLEHVASKLFLFIGFLTVYSYRNFSYFTICRNKISSPKSNDWDQNLKKKSAVPSWDHCILFCLLKAFINHYRKKISIFNVNDNRFSGPLSIRTFERRAPSQPPATLPCSLPGQTGSNYWWQSLLRAELSRWRRFVILILSCGLTLLTCNSAGISSC